MNHQLRDIISREISRARISNSSETRHIVESTDVHEMTKIEGKTLALVSVVLLSDLLFTGLIFGWAPLLLLLQDENQYSELCPDGIAPCEAQENRLNLLFALASFAVNAGALPVGIFLDYCGPKMSIIVAAIVEIVGLVLMAVADSKTFDVFLPGYILLAVGGQITMLASFPASFLVLEYQTAILAGISCLFDGSSIIFLALYSLTNAFPQVLTRQILFISYAILAGVIYLILIGLWHVNQDKLKPQEHPTIPQDESPLLDTKHTAKLMDKYRIEYGSLSEDSLLSPTRAVECFASGEAGRTLRDYPLNRQILTFEFGFGLLFASIQILRTNVYIGTNNKLLKNYGDAAHGNFYTKLFGLILPLGFIFVPAIDFAVEQHGLVISLLVTTLLGICFNTLALIPNLLVQSVVFFIFTAYRAFLYAVISAFNAKTFGLVNLGTIIGIIFTTGAMFNLLEYPAVTITNDWFHGNCTPMYLVMLFLAFCLLPLIEVYRRRENRREDRYHTALLSSGLFPFKSSSASSSFHRYHWSPVVTTTE